MEDMIKETVEYGPDVAVKPKPIKFKSSGPTLDAADEQSTSKTQWPSSGNSSKGKGKGKPTNSKAGEKWPKTKGGPGNHGQQKKTTYIVRHHSMYNNSVYLSHWYYPFLFIQMNHCDVTINNGVVDRD